MEIKVTIHQNDVIFIDRVDKCQICGLVGELRPYGPNDELICFKCGMKNLDLTKKKFIERYQKALQEKDQ